MTTFETILASINRALWRMKINVAFMTRDELERIQTRLLLVKSRIEELESDLLEEGRALRDTQTALRDLAAGNGDKAVELLGSEILQLKRSDGIDMLTGDAGEDRSKAMLTSDPQAALAAVDKARASEVAFRQVRTVNRELRGVIKAIVKGVRNGLEGSRLTNEQTFSVEAILADAVSYTDLPGGSYTIRRAEAVDSEDQAGVGS